MFLRIRERAPKAVLLCVLFTALTAVLCKSNTAAKPEAGGKVSYPSYLKISGPPESMTGAVAQIERTVKDGLSVLNVDLQSPGSRVQITVSPWPENMPLPQCAADCTASYSRNLLPDGPETRLELRSANKLVFFAASQGRLRRVVAGEAITLDPGVAGAAEFLGRMSVSLLVNRKPVQAGNSYTVAGCSIFVAQASVAKPARKGIADEAASFTADWLLRCK